MDYDVRVAIIYVPYEQWSVGVISPGASQALLSLMALLTTFFLPHLSPGALPCQFLCFLSQLSQGCPSHFHVVITGISPMVWRLT